MSIGVVLSEDPLNYDACWRCENYPNNCKFQPSAALYVIWHKVNTERLYWHTLIRGFVVMPLVPVMTWNYFTIKENVWLHCNIVHFSFENVSTELSRLSFCFSFKSKSKGYVTQCQCNDQVKISMTN